MISFTTLPVKAYSGNDTIPFRHSLRFGAEVYYPARILLESEIQQFEASLDFEFADRWFVVVEGGVLNVDIERDNFNYFSDGYFYRSGIDLNIFGRDALDDNDMVYIGLRYGYSNQKHGADNITISDEYWGDFQPTGQTSDFQAQWGELVAGLKTELFKNFFIGWSIRYRFLFSETDDILLKPYRISGYGRVDDNRVVDFNYSIYYRIAF